MDFFSHCGKGKLKLLLKQVDKRRIVQQAIWLSETYATSVTMSNCLWINRQTKRQLYKLLVNKPTNGQLDKLLVNINRQTDKWTTGNLIQQNLCYCQEKSITACEQTNRQTIRFKETLCHSHDNLKTPLKTWLQTTVPLGINTNVCDGSQRVTAIPPGQSYCSWIN